MKVVFCWQMVSGYMGACWRALAAERGVDLHVLALAPGGMATFDPAVMDGVPHELFDHERLDDPALMIERVRAQNPDVVVLCGWASKSWPAVARDPALKGVRKIMAMDTPYKGNLRQRLGRYLMRSYFNEIDMVFVAGERTRHFAELLGFGAASIRASTYGFDHASFAPVAGARDPAAPMRSFLFVGRYAPEKGLDTLVNAYRRYRDRVEHPWELACCGRGPLEHLLKGVEGVRDAGFVQPADLPGQLARSSVFVLASSYEPWGVVVAEAAAAGMPVICTDRVGASIDIVRPFHSGQIVAAGREDQLADALVWFHEHPERVHPMGVAASNASAAYAAPVWAERYVDAMRSLLGR